MHRARLTSLLSRCFREESFALIVSPAIADFQFERGKMSRVQVVRSYICVWHVLCTALWLDVLWNMHLWAVDGSRRTTSHLQGAAMPPALLLTSYVACGVVFLVDIGTGAQRLSRSALVHDPTLRSVVVTALIVLSAAALLSVLRGISKRLVAAISLGGVVVFLGATGLRAQIEPLPTRMVTVEGRAMRVWSAGIEQRKPGQPVVILEFGAADPGTFPLDAWQPVFPEIARIAPVLAYERRGNGMSEDDTERPTMRRVARVLHALLQETRIAPPYILVGQSWGGNYIRAFVDQYPNEVVGLVFLDAATGVGPTREEKAAVLPPELRAAALAPPVLPPMPPNISDGLRAEFEEIGNEMLSDGQESRTLRPISGIPVAIVVATPPGRLRGNAGAVVRLMIRHDLELALASPNGIFVTANHVGHIVHKDDPALVARLIKHVLDHVGVATRDLR